MHLRILVVLALLALFSGSHAGRAQSTTEQLPSAVPVDSILALQGNPEDYPGEDVVVLFRDRNIRLESNGESRSTFRQVVQIISASGAEEWGNYSFSYNESRQRFRLNWLRVVQLDGTIISDGAEVQQETSYEANHDVPVFSDTRLVRMSASGVRAGVVVDYSYTIDTFDPVFAGDIWNPWFANLMIPIRRSRLTLETPADTDVRVSERGVSAAVDSVSNGTRTRVWVVEDQPAVELEPYAGWPNDVFRRVRVSGKLEWKDVGASYWPRIQSKLVASAVLSEAAARQLEGATSLADTLRALHRWVAQDIRYTSIALGEGSHDPRTPDAVLESRLGDCKDKTTLFLAAARDVGVDASPVLVSLSSRVDSLAPSIWQFDHMIARVDRGDAVDYVDLTVDVLPYGQLPYELEGGVGLVIRDGGDTDVVVLPANPAHDNRFEHRVTGSLDLQNRFTGHATFAAHGTSEQSLRSYFKSYRDQDDEARRRLERGFLRSYVWESVEIDSVDIFDPWDLANSAEVTFWFTVDDVLGQTGDRYTMYLPIPVYYDGSSSRDLGSVDDRTFPIDVGQVNDQTEYVSTFEIELPDRWRAELPAAVSESGRFGEYESSYRQIGNRVTIKRSMQGRRGIEPPDVLDDLIAWFDAVIEDDRESISLVVLEGGLDIGAEPPAAAGSLPEILLSLDDLPAGAEMSEEGPVGNSYITMADEPIESFGRTFGPEQIFFSIGESRVMMLHAEAGAFETEAEASQTLSVFARIEPGAVMEAMMAQVAGDQVTIGEPRPLRLDGDEFESHGWVVEMSTPLFSMHVANLSAVRGRVVVSLAGVLLPDPQMDEFVQLAQAMLDRVGSHASYLEPSADVAEKIIELCTVEGLIGQTPVDKILPSSEEFPESEQDCFGEESEEGVAFYGRTITGRSFAFPVISSEASNVETYLGRFESSHDAMRALIEMEEENLSSWSERTVGDADIGDILLGAGGSTIEHREMPDLGWRAISRSVRMRGGIKADADEVVFVRGEFLAGVMIYRLLSDADPEEAETIAARIDERLSAAIGDSVSPRPSDESLERLKSIVAAEILIDSLATAQDIPSALSLLEGIELSESPFDLSANTWNLLCWYGSLNGFVDEVMHACESAVASDSTVISYIDSRGLARAVAGDITGAASDFGYVVEHAPQGEFLDTRAAWLEELRMGENPFTDEVLQELREQ